MTDPHHNEYLAAVAGLGDQTISPPTTVMVNGVPTDTYLIGDRVAFLEQGHRLLGVVVERVDATTYRIRRHVPDHGNVTHLVDAESIVPF